MTTSPRKPKAAEKREKPPYKPCFVPATALAKTVAFDDVMMQVTLTDGRVLGVPLAWFPMLQQATPKQRARCKIGGGGISLHWPDLDEDLSMANLMAGADSRSA